MCHKPSQRLGGGVLRTLTTTHAATLAHFMGADGKAHAKNNGLCDATNHNWMRRTIPGARNRMQRRHNTNKQLQCEAPRATAKHLATTGAPKKAPEQGPENVTELPDEEEDPLDADIENV